jgi:CRISPR-associated protein Cas1
MVNEYVYCPRLAYLEWIQGEWEASADTVEGKQVHKRVDQRETRLPPAAEQEEDVILHSRSVTLSSEQLGAIAKLDLIEAEGKKATPVEYKRGKRPHVAKGAFDPERVQLCLQGMLLEENGYTSDGGILYFAASRERVHIAFDEELKALTRSAIQGLRQMADQEKMPPPLTDSPKCPRCSLVGICLPDEVNFFQQTEEKPRPLFVARDEALPVYVQAYKASIRKKGEVLHITTGDNQTVEARLNETSMLVLQGNPYLTTPCMHELLRRQIPVCWQSYGGWFLGYSVSNGHNNVELRTAQYRASFDKAISLQLARWFIRAKILNCRTMLRRNWRGEEKPIDLLFNLKQDANNAASASSAEQLLGIEGTAAARYFSSFQQVLKQRPGSLNFMFSNRNRRPPADPVNAMLSYSYALLVKTWTVTLTMVGFDPFRGFYHQIRYGRPSLALDLMESFRPLIADSTVIQVINNNEIPVKGFITQAGGCTMKEKTRKKLITAFERRLSQEITHPIFGYRVSYRRLLELQARLLSRYLLGDIEQYPDFTTR